MRFKDLGSTTEQRLSLASVSRRDFMKYCTALAAAMGLEATGGQELAEAFLSRRRPSVVYLHNAECTGCSEALLRLANPTFAELVFDIVSLDYHETVMMASGHTAEAALDQALNNPDGFFCVIEGAIPTKDGGGYGFIAGHSMMEICTKVATKAKGVIAMGSCASFGGVQAAAPNPSGAKGVGDCLGGFGVTPINIPGCPPNPINFVGTVSHILLQGELPALDSLNRPKMFFGRTVHDTCERNHHFLRGEFAPSFSSPEAKKGWCLYKLGCKGPYTYNNCPTATFNQTSYPMKSGHPCIGCSEPDFWDNLSPFYQEVDATGGRT